MAKPNANVVIDNYTLSYEQV